MPISQFPSRRTLPPTAATMTVDRPETPPDRPSSSPAPADPPRVHFAELAAGGREVLILHGGHCYRLIETRHGKLLLNK